VKLVLGDLAMERMFHVEHTQEHQYIIEGAPGAVCSAEAAVIRSLEPGVWSPESGARSLEPGAWSLESGAPEAGAWSPEPEAATLPRAF
jgi:hypothetical protein